MRYTFRKEGSAEGSRSPRELFAEIIETLDPEGAVVISIAPNGDGLSVSTTNGGIDYIKTMLAVALDLMNSEDVCNGPPPMLQ